LLICFRTLGAAGIPQFSLAVQAFTNARTACYPAISAMERSSDRGCQPNKITASASALGTSLSKCRKIGSVVSPEVISADSLKFDNIRFDNVCFSYPARPDEVVLANFSFSLKSGQTIGIVGPSGSGVRLHLFAALVLEG
jgi:ABC-type multidrug transport system fused ATPase/permease subunit